MTHSVSWYEIAEILAQNDDYESVREALERHAPKPTHPERLLGRWAKHPEHGDVLIGDDVPVESCVVVIVRDGEKATGSSRKHVALSSLTFPHQATRPEDVPVGEAWLVNVDDRIDSGERVVALKYADDGWRTGVGVVNGEGWWLNRHVTLISPLVPARPEPQPDHPRTLSSVEDYETAPEGTIVAAPDNSPWTKICDDEWKRARSRARMTNFDMAELTEQDLLRKGWGNE